MKQSFSRLFIITLSVIFLSIPIASSAQEDTQMDVDVSAICKGIVEMEPIGSSISFPVSAGKLYCFTRIVGAQTPTQVTHVWYFGLIERARVDLAIKSSTWRTYSSKIIQPHEIGSWRVEVLDPEGTVLKVIQFITTSVQDTVQEEMQADVPVPEEEQSE